MEFNSSDSNYFLNYNGLYDVLIFYKDYNFESKMDEIKIIEESIKYNEKIDYYKYLNDYEIAKEMNKRTALLNIYIPKKRRNILIKKKE